MNTSIKNKIIDIAKNNPTEEICGYIYYGIDGKSNILESKNQHLHKNKMFLTDPSDYIRLSESTNTIVGVYHSHTIGDETFSESDIEYADTWELPIFVYSLSSDKWNSYTPMSYAPTLIGRPFCWGFSDCFELVRDYYRAEKGVNLSDYERDASFAGSNSSIIIENFEKEGFVKLPDNGLILKNDIILFKCNTVYPLHLAVFQGKSRMIHHPMGRLSASCFLDRPWTKKISMILRYKIN